MKQMLYILISLLPCNSAIAQESMMQDVSSVYIDKLIAMAKINYPRFQWTAAKVNVAQAGVNKAKMGCFDVFNIAYIYNPNNTIRIYGNNNEPYNNNLWNGYQAGINVNMGAVLQKPAIIRQAKEELNVARYDKKAVDLNLEAEVKRRYLTYLQHSNILRLKIKVAIDGDNMSKTVKHKFEKGEVSFDSYNQILISSSLYTQERITAEAAMLIAKTDLEELLGTNLENIK